jgi:phosphate-selective porin
MKRCAWLSLVLVLGCGSGWLWAGDKVVPGVEQRLAQLEDEVQTLRQENASLHDNLGVPDKKETVGVKAFGRESELKLGGFLQMQAEFGDKGDSRFSNNNDRIFLRRARVNASGKFAEHFDFRIEMELAGSLSEASSMRAQLTDVYIQWSQFEEARVRVGQYKTPYGYEQLFYDPGLLTIERSLPNDRLTLSRQIGVQVSGDFLEKRLGYSIGVFNGTSVNTNENDDSRFLLAGRVTAVPWQGKLGRIESKWTVGVNSFFSDDKSVSGMAVDFGFDSVPGGIADNIFSGNRRGVGVDTQFSAGPFSLQAEYLTETFRPTDHLPLRQFESDGYYIQAGWFILPKRLQAIAKYEYFDPNTGRVGGSTENHIVGMNWFIKGDDIRLQLNYYLSNPAGYADNQQKVLMKLQVIF